MSMSVNRSITSVNQADKTDNAAGLLVLIAFFYERKGTGNGTTLLESLHKDLEL